ncbi:MAG: hypothetical protein BGO01_01855 [Armatimonadetes bacterium 55-13]|nr:MAG: hypothetical protein BGO01_01855 [Armatimonadetes bacterium 55-13]
MLSVIAPLLLNSLLGQTAPVVLENKAIRVSIQVQDGTYDVTWKGAALKSVWGEARIVDDTIRRTISYGRHRIDGSVRDVQDALGKGKTVAIRHSQAGLPDLVQTFWVYDDRPEVIIRLDVAATKSTKSNYLAPAVSEGISFEKRGPLQALFVPWDNDMYFRYRSDGWGEGAGDGDGSYEVGAVYDDESRKGIVVGSLDHERWKSAIQFQRNAEGGVKSLRAFSGVTSKYTHDIVPHGSVTGKLVSSPRMVIGYYADWREGMERYGDLNAMIKPPLTWKSEVPFGWNSWSGFKTKITAEGADAATEFLKNDLPWFRSFGTAYVNLDSFWDNLTKDQRRQFVVKAHAAGLKAGIYYTPFTAWGDLSSPVRGTNFHYRDLAIKDEKGEPLSKLSGGWPLDPTHPETVARMKRQLQEFVDLGFDFVKLDFMSHGALEGQHADPKIETGAEAYAYGMQQIVDFLDPKRIGRPFFISLSIAPMFPQGYAHSRRISCDVFANIGATEYLLNSTNYGWWTNGRIYRFNDPDSSCVYQPKDEEPVTEAEARSRHTASAISGGMMMEGDDLTKPEARKRVLEIYSNLDVLSLAKQAVTFRPVFGDTATKGGDAFVYLEPNGKTAYVALFNFSKDKSVDREVTAERLGFPTGQWSGIDLWSKKTVDATHGIQFKLAPMDCALFKLTRS